MAQGVELETVAGTDGPRLIKRATTEAGRAHLAREADRLERAGHPGVVELLERADDHLVMAWAGEQTLAITRPALERTAWVLGVIAATVADLHDLGIVHGRLDPTHVVLGADGRPILCGLAGPEPGEPEPSATDDVACLGQLIDAVVGHADLEPIPDRRWSGRRWSGYHQRSLLSVADQATLSDPGARPTAREIAAAIGRTAPEAERSTHRLITLTAAAACISVIVLTVVAVRSDPPVEVARASAPAPVTTSLVTATASTTRSTTTASTTTAGPTCPAAAAPSADVDGDGCQERYRISGITLTASGRAYRVGQPGDHVSVADWDCDGKASPGLVRPATGEVFLFDGWARPEHAVTVDARAIVVGAVALAPPANAEPGGSACRAPRVRLQDGTFTPLPTAVR